MKRLDSKRFVAVLPFKRVNRNWYNAMAGAALLGNSEVAAGMYLFSEMRQRLHMVVCKEMQYQFLRPCLGPAVYHIVNTEAVDTRRSPRRRVQHRSRARGAAAAPEEDDGSAASGVA